MAWFPAIFRRDIPTRTPRTLIASAAAVDLRDPAVARRLTRLRGRWQEDAWTYRDEVGELRYALQFLSNVCRRMRLYPALASPAGVDPTPIGDIDPADDEDPVAPQLVADALDQVRRLAAGRAHAGEILGVGAELFEITGEGMLVGRVSGDTEHWSIHSVDEVRWADGTWTVSGEPGSPEGSAVALDPDLDYVARLWRPHPRYSARADSPMRALLDVCEELITTGRAIRVITRSRLPAGLLLLPEELTLAGTADTDTEEAAEDVLIAELGNALSTAVNDEASPASLVPFLMRGPGDQLDKVRLVQFLRDADPTLLDRQEKALRRLGMGLDVPPEIIVGMAEVNHWTAWQVDDSTFRHHVEPLVQVLVDALTVAFLRPALLALGHPPDQVARVVLWYDPADVVSKPNRGQDADLAHDRGTISDEAHRRARGFDEGDAPSEDELVRRAGLERGVLADPVLREILAVLLGQRALIDGVTDPAAGTSSGAPAADPVDAPAETGPPPEDTARVDPAGLTAAADAEAEARRRAQLSRRLAAIDRDLRARLHAAADAAVARAVERAGARVRAAAQRPPAGADLGHLRAQAQGVPVAQVPARLGRDVVTAGLGLDTAQLLADAFAVLAGQWQEWVPAAQEEAIDTAAALAGLDRDTTPVRRAVATLRDVLAAGATEGLRWLLARLTDLTSTALYDPAPAVEPRGEVSAARVPVGIVRGALAYAGGGPVHVTPTGLSAVPGQPLPGIGTGGPIAELLTASGLAVDDYEWVYGVSARPFEPHRDLDGARFDSWADPVLDARPGDATWIGPIYVPGDHPGCHCDYAPRWGGVSAQDQLEAIGDATYDPAGLLLLRRLALADIDAGRYDTSAVAAMVEAERAANTRPSQPQTDTPVTDALAAARSRRLAAAGAR